MFPKALRIHVIALICLKIALLTVIYQLFFAPAVVRDLDGDRVRSHLLSDTGR